MTDEFRIRCTNPDCDTTLALEGSRIDWAGETVECPNCSTKIIIPGIQIKGQSESLQPSTCPYCGEQIAPNATICISCGINLKTGEKLQTQSTASRETRPTTAVDTAPSQPSFIFAIVSIGIVLLITFGMLRGCQDFWREAEESSAAFSEQRRADERIEKRRQIRKRVDENFVGIPTEKDYEAFYRAEGVE